MSEPLPAEFRDALAASAARRGVFGERVIFLAETSSTNDIAMAAAERGAPEGTMALALAQTAGRGRMGREWASPAGAGLYASLVLRNAAVVPALTLAGGVAVAEGVRRATALPVVLKWPNDVVVREDTAPGRRRKLAGVLAEGSTGADGLQHVVLGFGVNVRRADYPPAVAARATSIELELGRPVDAGQVLAEILAALHEQVTDLAAGRKDVVLDRWRQLAPTAAGSRIEWTIGGATLRGITIGIDDSGALLVRVEGRIDRIIAGEVRWL